MLRKLFEVAPISTWGLITELIVGFVITPRESIRQMLVAVEASSEDVLVDLGCGNGNILITSVEEFHVNKAVGYEIRKEIATMAKINIKKRNLQNKIQIVNDNLFNSNLTEATIVTLFLTPAINSVVEHWLRTKVTSGTRIVSFSHKFQQAVPAKTVYADNSLIFIYHY